MVKVLFYGKLAQPVEEFDCAALIVLLLMVMSRLHKLKTGSGLLVTHALLTDLSFCLVLNPVINIPIYLTQMRIPMTYHCILPDFLLPFHIYLGNWTAVALAVNRVIAIVFPHLYPHVSSQRFSVGVLLVVWSIAMSCTVPIFAVPGMLHGQLPSGACGLLRLQGVTFTVVGAIGSYLPIILLGIIYIGLFIYARVTKTHYRRNSADRQRTIWQKRLAIAKALFLCFAWYTVCTLPPSVLAIFYGFWWNKEVRLLLFTRGAQIIGYSASPVFFFAMNADYRAALKNYLCIHKPHGGKVRAVNSSTKAHQSFKPYSLGGVI
ncbi:neuromedin-U receptor 2-like [Paramacrobiotus metropolitanus]|uniref:neuromedin-U receptor 2-like n=1 Tax=Paramacrobiotus metropolitanus TaxID=2943436 RepID=UPI0024463410|nr:neuromedin-U receptor 2-like [Paramacrobiotus metropolitanus]